MLNIMPVVVWRCSNGVGHVSEVTLHRDYALMLWNCWLVDQKGIWPVKVLIQRYSKVTRGTAYLGVTPANYASQVHLHRLQLTSTVS